MHGRPDSLSKRTATPPGDAPPPPHRNRLPHVTPPWDGSLLPPPREQDGPGFWMVQGRKRGLPPCVVCDGPACFLWVTDPRREGFLAHFCVECGERNIPLLRPYQCYAGPRPRPPSTPLDLLDKMRRGACWPDITEDRRSMRKSGGFFVSPLPTEATSTIASTPTDPASQRKKDGGYPATAAGNRSEGSPPLSRHRAEAVSSPRRNTRRKG